MSRTSRITEGLDRLVDGGVIVAYTRMDSSQVHWLIQRREEQHYYTSSEAEAFIDGVEALRSFATRPHSHVILK